MTIGFFRSGRLMPPSPMRKRSLCPPMLIDKASVIKNRSPSEMPKQHGPTECYKRCQDAHPRARCMRDCRRPSLACCQLLVASATMCCDVKQPFRKELLLITNDDAAELMVPFFGSIEMKVFIDVIRLSHMDRSPPRATSKPLPISSISTFDWTA